MPENRLRRLISQDFPLHEYEEVMAILEGQGKSRSIKQHVKDFATLVQVSAGDLTNLRLYTQTATNQDLEQFRSWLHTRVDYLTRLPEAISFFAAAMIPLAKASVNLGFTFKTNNGSLMLLDDRRQERCYLIPTIDQKVFVTKCREAIFSGKASSNLSPYDGRFVECDQVADFVSDVFANE